MRVGRMNVARRDELRRFAEWYETNVRHGRNAPTARSMRERRATLRAAID